MFAWIAANWGTLSVAAVLGIIVCVIVRSLARARKQGRPSCGGNCAGCPGCAARPDGIARERKAGTV